MQVVAITGSIGCGKTTLADLVRGLGYVVYAADKWCRYLYYKKDFLEQIAQNFPQSFIEGQFNKRLLRQMVFSDNEKLKKLEELTHPFLKKKFLNAIHNNRFNDDVIFVDIAILFEIGWDRYCTHIIVADVEYEVQKKRVMERDNILEADFKKIVQIQMDNDHKKKLADIVINTNRSLGQLKVELIHVINGIKVC